MTKTTLSLVLCASVCAALSGCGGKNAANEKNFGVTVTQYFDKKGELCLDPIKWPVDVYELDMRQQKMYPDNAAGQMSALEAAGLARGEDVTVPETKAKVRRYTMLEAAKPFLREKAGKAPRLCWGRKSLEKVVRWADPVKKSGQEETAVIYTYQLADVAPWAKLPQVKEAFPELGRNVDGEHKQKEKLYVKLTDKGWEAYGLNE